MICLKYCKKKSERNKKELIFKRISDIIHNIEKVVKGENSMNDVLDVCRYAINYSNEKEYGISNLKLQKILYFIQAYFLMITKSPCFSAKIKAWDFGPVVPEAYREYKQYGSANIPTVKSYIEFDETNPWNSKSVKYNDSVIEKKDKKMINAVVDKFADYSATDLVKLTHRQTPWREAYKKNQNAEITIDAIEEYFNE